MKQSIHHSILLILAFGLFSVGVSGQDSTKPELLLEVSYHAKANKLAYISALAKTKIEKKFQPVEGLRIKFYLNTDSLPIGSSETDARGIAITALPPRLKPDWDAAGTHTLIAISEANKTFDETKAEFALSKSKLLIDTVQSEGRNVKINVLEQSDSDWIPCKDAEVKIMIQRLGGDLPISEETSYTTDSTGTVIAEFKRENLPGDAKGNLLLIAKIEDNDHLGNIAAELKVPWGVINVHKNTFEKRSLYATNDKAPYWLLFIAGLIITIVWGCLVYLLYLIFRIKQLDKWQPKKISLPD